MKRWLRDAFAARPTVTSAEYFRVRGSGDFVTVTFESGRSAVCDITLPSADWWFRLCSCVWSDTAELVRGPHRRAAKRAAKAAAWAEIERQWQCDREALAARGRAQENADIARAFDERQKREIADAERRLAAKIRGAR